MNTSMMRQLIPKMKKTLTRFVTVSSQPSSAKATIINSGKGAVFGTAYEGFKRASRVYGFYQDIKPYLPETYIDKYRYKPHKRIAGQLQKTQGFLRRNASSYKFSKKRAQCTVWNNFKSNKKHFC